MSKFDLDLDDSNRKLIPYLKIPIFYLDLQRLSIKDHLTQLEIYERYLGLKGLVWMGVEGLEGEFLVIESVTEIPNDHPSDDKPLFQEAVRMISMPAFPCQEILLYICRGRLGSKQISLASVLIEDDFDTNFYSGIALTPIELSLAWWQVRSVLARDFGVFFSGYE